MPRITIGKVVDPIIKTQRDLGLPEAPGPTEKGWSILSRYMACPKRFELSIGATRSSSGEATQIGIAFHQVMELHYMPRDVVTPESFLTCLERHDIKVGSEARRLYEAYVEQYRDEGYLTPLAVEAEHYDPDLDVTIRMDMVAQIKGHRLYPRGVYIIDHKTSGRFDRTLENEWASNGQVLLYSWVFQKLNLAEHYATNEIFQGVMINVIGKQKKPRFMRIHVPPIDSTLKGFDEEVRYWSGRLRESRLLGYFPRNRSSCVGRYGLCPFQERCI